MKTSHHCKNIIIISIIIISIGKVSLLLNFHFPTALTLRNKNVFIVERDGIYVYDEQLKNLISNYSFQSNEKITSSTILSNVIIKYEGSHVICLIRGKIFFLII